MSQEHTSIEVFCSYAQADEAWLLQLEKHLSLLQRQGLIKLWQKRRLVAGADWAKAIDTHLETASVILLLISADFLASDYCSGVEMQRALQRQKVGEAHVIPILLHPTDCKDAPFAHLQALPTGAKPLSTWKNKAEALANVAAGIRRAIEELPHLTAKAPRSSLPAIWNIPYPRNPFFLGRDELLTRLHDQLQAGQVMALSQPQAISGLGGIGKTQLAVEYAYRHARNYQAILWVGADTHEALISGFVALAKLLGLPQKNEHDQKVIVQAVKHWLKTTHLEWLLIFDNADDPSLVSEFLRSLLGGHVLLTTRAYAVGSLAQRVEVETMSQEEGALLLLRRAGLMEPGTSLGMISPAERAAACAITQELGGLPLALDQAGAYLEETRCSLISYQQVFQQHRMQLLRRRGRFSQDYPFSVATTWALSFERIKEQSPAAADLLCCCAFLHPDAIPEELFTGESSRHLGIPFQQVTCDNFAFNEAIRVLLTYSLIHRDPQTATLSLHRLVQAVLLNAMPEEQQSRWQEYVVQALNEAFPENVLQEWTRCGRLLSHVRVCVSWIEQELLPSSEALSLLEKTGAYLQECREHSDAETFLRQALAMRKQQLGDQHPDLARCLNRLSALSYQQGKYEQIEVFAGQALAICEQFLGAKHPETATSLQGQAIVYRMQGKHKQAEAVLVRALAIYEQCLGTHHPDTARCLSNLACVYGLQGKYEQAEESNRRAISIYEQQLGTHHHRTVLYGWYFLGELYLAQGKYEQAKPLFERALVICKQLWGTESLETMVCLSGLARVYLEQGQYEQAKPLFEQAFAVRERHQEEGRYGEAAFLFHGLAKLFQHEGNYEQAKKMYGYALKNLETREGSTLITKQEVQRDYATFLRLVGRDAEAVLLDTSQEEPPDEGDSVM
ncbi:MAG TPA: FxSxx-COOH system tetratricopeptide repeat protein [Ktedonosporobacter sp.]|nr:FxSxx-COOH system tetratricopeptide repeat protein [Ktedonosporobacter sp.]